MASVFTSKLLLICLLLLVFFLLYHLVWLVLSIALPFLLAHFLARWIGPTARKIPSNRARSLFTILALVAMIAFLGLLIFGLGRLTAAGLRQFSDQTPLIMEELTSLVDRALTALRESTFFVHGPSQMTELINDAIRSLVSQLGTAATSTFSVLVNTFAFFPQVLLLSIIALLSSYFMIVEDLDLFRLFPEVFERLPSQHPLFRIFKNQVLHVVWAYLKVQFILMGVTFLLSSVGLTLLGFSYAPLVGLGIAIVDFFPMLGPAAVYIPWVLVIWLTGEGNRALLLFFLYLLVTFTRQFLQPQILSVQIGLDPLWTLISLYAGLKIMGIWGIIIGPLVVLLIKALLQSDLNLTDLTNKL